MKIKNEKHQYCWKIARRVRVIRRGWTQGQRDTPLTRVVGKTKKQKQKSNKKSSASLLLKRNKAIKRWVLDHSAAMQFKHVIARPSRFQAVVAHTAAPWLMVVICHAGDRNWCKGGWRLQDRRLFILFFFRSINVPTMFWFQQRLRKATQEDPSHFCRWFVSSWATSDGSSDGNIRTDNYNET